MNSLPSGTVTFLFTDIEGSTNVATGDQQQLVLEAISSRFFQPF